ncbi:hypothetical protein DEO72_LG10g1371 [Vigna unguiculata]|uniref:Uncharacterized protein n=1 Tax=Vigna unguiculata TaxID=3917 RepID=A0A4D6NDD4_VIGUN|nr:hypothetical protein DEO72_LG10g1371 [Vigna unguiculata]
MSSGGPPNPSKGKEIAKPKAKKAPKRPCYLIKVPPTRPSTSIPIIVANTHSAPLQSTSPAVAPMPLPSIFVPIVEATPPPVMVPKPPFVMVPIPPPVMVPTPPRTMVPTLPPITVPTPRPPLVPTTPSIMVLTPPLMMMPIPPLVVVRSEQGSYVGPSDPNAHPTTEDTIRT